MYSDNNQNNNLYNQSLQNNQTNQNYEINNTTNNKKKNKIALIISIIIIVVIIGIITIFLLNNNNNSNNKNNNDNEIGSNSTNKNNSLIKQLEYSFGSSVTILDNEGNLYAIGEEPGHSEWGIGIDYLEKPTLIASNVKKFYSNGLIYIDNEDNLYISGVDPINGGTFDTYTKIGENIKEVDGSSLALIAISNDGDLYAYGNETYNGIGVKCEQLTKVEGVSNVKDIVLTPIYVYYITENGDLYAKETMSDAEFVKLLEHVVETNDGSIVRTSGGEIYHISYDYKEEKVKAVLNEEANGYILHYYTKDGKFLNSSSYVYDYMNYAYPDDVKEMLYIGSGKATYFIYINNNNKLVLYEYNYDSEYDDEKKEIYYIITTKQKKELDYNVDSLNEIYEFLKEAHTYEE